MRVGFSFLQQGRYEAACTLFGRARERAPRRLTVLLATNNIAWAQLLIDTPESRASAVSLAEEAVAGMEALEDPAAAAYRDAARGTFALALIATGRDAQGVRLVREILARPRPTKPVEATRQAILAIGLAHLGDRSGAIRAADEARAGDPRCILLPRAQQAIDARPRT